MGGCCQQESTTAEAKEQELAEPERSFTDEKEPEEYPAAAEVLNNAGLHGLYDHEVFKYMLYRWRGDSRCETWLRELSLQLSDEMSRLDMIVPGFIRSMHPDSHLYTKAYIYMVARITIFEMHFGHGSTSKTNFGIQEKRWSAFRADLDECVWFNTNTFSKLLVWIRRFHEIKKKAERKREALSL